MAVSAARKTEPATDRGRKAEPARIRRCSVVGKDRGLVKLVFAIWHTKAAFKILLLKPQQTGLCLLCDLGIRDCATHDNERGDEREDTQFHGSVRYP